jgi:serine/threonine-protein kinase RsbW
MEGARRPLGPLEIRREPPRIPGEAGFLLEIPADVRCVEPAVQLLSDQCFAEGPPPQGRTVFRLRVLLAEAISNSILFGAAGNPDRTVRIEARVSLEQITVEVTDDGPGFDPAEVPDPTLPDGLGRPVGRGLFLIRSLADRVEFNEQGNTIWMTLARC